MGNTWYQKIGATPRKVGLVAVLAAVLLGTLASQWFGSDQPVDRENPAVAATRRPRTGPSSRPGAGTQGSEAAEPTVLPRWPIPENFEWSAYDPFAVPWRTRNVAAAADVPQEEANTAAVPDPRNSKLLTQKVAVVVIGQDGPIAMVGSHILRVGDVIDGLFVTKIDEEGVVLVDKNIATEPGTDRANRIQAERGGI